MSATFLKRGSQWWPAIVVLTIVSLAGSRLTMLSVREHARQLRAEAQTAVVHSAAAIEAQLQKEADRARLHSLSVDLDPLLANVPLSRLLDARYDFELSKLDVRGGRHMFMSSRPVPLSDPAVARLRAPAGFTADLPSGYLQLAIRPKSGWYPARELATALGLLAIVTWLLTFGTYDLMHTLRRARDALAEAKQKQQILNRRLLAEMERRQQLQQSFEHARYHDAFTGLPNRRYFMDQLDHALRDVRGRRRERIVIVLVDIDRFRLINDTLGHTAADELMLQAARRFEKAATTLECVLARWSADQLAVLVFDVPADSTPLAVVDTLQETFSEPFELRRHRLSITARMGITTIESGLQRAEDAVREADIALSFAKRQEGVKAIVYTPAMGGDAASLVSLEADLHVAMQRNELRLLFQPIVELRGGRIVGAEALLRWEHPIEGLLRPERFLNIAEESGLIASLTHWVILRVCRLAGDWHRRLPPQSPHFYFSINLSAAVLREPGFTDFVAQTLHSTGLPASALKFELTEGGLISHVGEAREALDRLHGMGIELMLDDFGTGYSSLSYLQLFPFDYLKMDRLFVNPAGNPQVNSSIACALLQMASSLGLKSVAEIVETQEAARALAAWGCDYGQGYFFSEPVEAEDILQQLHAQQDDSPTLLLTPLPEQANG